MAGEPLFDVWLVGVQPDAPDPTMDLAQAFGIDVERVEKLLSQIPCVVKKEATAKVAARVEETLGLLGCDCDVKPTGEGIDANTKVDRLSRIASRPLAEVHRRISKNPPPARDTMADASVQAAPKPKAANKFKGTMMMGGASAPSQSKGGFKLPKPNAASPANASPAAQPAAAKATPAAASAAAGSSGGKFKGTMMMGAATAASMPAPEPATAEPAAAEPAAAEPAAAEPAAAEPAAAEPASEERISEARDRAEIESSKQAKPLGMASLEDALGSELDLFVPDVSEPDGDSIPPGVVDDKRGVPAVRTDDHEGMEVYDEYMTSSSIPAISIDGVEEPVFPKAPPRPKETLDREGEVHRKKSKAKRAQSSKSTRRPSGASVRPETASAYPAKPTFSDVPISGPLYAQQPEDEPEKQMPKGPALWPVIVLAVGGVGLLLLGLVRGDSSFMGEAGAFEMGRDALAFVFLANAVAGYLVTSQGQKFTIDDFTYIGSGIAAALAIGLNFGITMMASSAPVDPHIEELARIQTLFDEHKVEDAEQFLEQESNGIYGLKPKEAKFLVRDIYAAGAQSVSVEAPEKIGSKKFAGRLIIKLPADAQSKSEVEAVYHKFVGDKLESLPEFDRNVPAERNFWSIIVDLSAY